MRRAACSALALILSLSACGGAKEGDGKERKTAAGEVLGGSISDAMLPLATVQSQSPPLRESAGETGDNASADAKPKDADKDAAPTPSPSATAAPEAGASASPTPPAAN